MKTPKLYREGYAEDAARATKRLINAREAYFQALFAAAELGITTAPEEFDGLAEHYDFLTEDLRVVSSSKQTGSQ